MTANRRPCGCCCGPITERFDDFDSQWPCWKGDANPLSYADLLPDWYFDTVNSQLIREDTGTAIEAQRAITADAVRVPIPYSMEIVVDVNNYYASTLRIQATQVFNDGTAFAKNIYGTGFINPQTAGTGGPFIMADMEIGDGTGTTNNTRWQEASPGTGPFKVQYRMQVDTDGITHWCWYNDVLATVVPGAFGAPSLAWGTKWSRSFSTWTLASGYNSYWTMWGQRATSTPSTIGKFDSLEVAIWDHTVTSRPTP